MHLDAFAFFTVYLILKLLSFVEFCQTVIYRGVTGLIINVKITLFCWCVIYNFVCRCIVIVCKLFWVPLDGDETFSDELLDKDRGICRHDYATTTSLHPVAYGTRIPCLVNCFQDERLKDALFWRTSFSPIFFLPPSSHRSMEPGCRFQ